MTETQAIIVYTFPSHEFRMFQVAGVSNAKFSMVKRHLGRYCGSDGQGNYNIKMDKPTSDMVDAIFRSPAVDELTLTPNSVRVELNRFFRWSEVQGWILHCILQRLGQPGIEGASPVAARRAIRTNYYGSAVVDLWVSGPIGGQHVSLVAYGSLKSYGRPSGVGHGPEGDVTMGLLWRFFEANAVKEVSIDHNRVMLTLRERMSQEEVGRAVTHARAVLIKHLGWDETEVGSDLALEAEVDHYVNLPPGYKP